MWVVIRRQEGFTMHKNMPTQAHYNVLDAKDEAERLARGNPNVTFYVCELPVFASVVVQMPAPPKPVTEWEHYPNER